MRRLIARILFPPTLAYNVVLGRWLRIRHWWDRIDEHVILGALPFAADVPKLAALGVRAVVNTCEEYAGPVSRYDEFQIEQLRVPTIDFTAPSLASVESAVTFMQRHISQGHTVYVHCKAGRARSATVVLCWLMAAKQITAEEAQAWLLRCRPHVNRRVYLRSVVQAFADIAR